MYLATFLDDYLHQNQNLEIFTLKKSSFSQKYGKFQKADSFFVNTSAIN